ncbi:MAG: gfo/Idh/MocA family oxidoreductase [Chloroflexi bacterium]|nr:gfo/Idh/MocA family oxidoreductase [Chloroflexota bacterium]MDL1941770.1 Gfo/Idh/MocA family oxidoreductase [Chloroflexi bacterium CFX2]
MDKALNWGLLSTAKINRALIKPLRASKRTRLLGAASRSLAAAEAYAREWEIPRAYGSYEAMLADPEIDVVYNSLPNHLHAEWTIKALRAGKHVLCEKPLALSLAEVDAMSAAAQETGRVLAEAFMYRHHPQTLKAREIVDGGALGELRLIKGAFTFTLTREGNYRTVKEMGGGSLWDVGCYPISFARMIVGEEPLEVFGWQVEGPGGTDESFFGELRFGGGVHAQFDCGFKSHYRSYIEIVGTEGVLNISNPFKPGIKSEIQLTRGDETQTIKIKGQELYSGEVEDMCDAILNGKPPRVSLTDSRGNIAAILGLLESAQTGRSFVLPGIFV